MVSEEIIKSLSIRTDSKILLLIMDGVGGLAVNGKTELETARTPNLDKLASMSACGLADPISRGITPGSGPSHAAVFGYDPLKYEIGRGVLETLGIGLELTRRDLAGRGNFATRDGSNIITDRRAGRIPTEKNIELCSLMQEKIRKIDDAEVMIRPVREHRFAVVFRGEGLEGPLADADPQKEGLPAKPALPLSNGARKAADIANKFIEKVNIVLKDEKTANTVLLRGLAKVPSIPSMTDLFKLNPAAIATYPMYRGLARLVGMEVLKTGETIADEFETLKNNLSKYDFFYLHVKKTDSYGEDGNFSAKVRTIEETDKALSSVFGMGLDVMAVTGDHSTPALLKGHSWHPNPFMLYSKLERVDGVKKFSEKECARGGLGRFCAVDAMPMMLASALKMKKFGA